MLLATGQRVRPVRSAKDVAELSVNKWILLSVHVPGQRVMASQTVASSFTYMGEPSMLDMSSDQAVYAKSPLQKAAPAASEASVYTVCTGCDPCRKVTPLNSKSPLTKFCTLIEASVLQKVPYSKYMGIDNTSALDWSNHS